MSQPILAENGFVFMAYDLLVLLVRARERLRRR